MFQSGVGICWPSSDSSSLIVGISSKGQWPGLGMFRCPPVPPGLGSALSLAAPMGGQACARYSRGSVELAWSGSVALCQMPGIPGQVHPAFCLVLMGWVLRPGWLKSVAVGAEPGTLTPVQHLFSWPGAEQGCSVALGVG